jgi:L-iditol 2-dehydrogenase
VKAAVLTAPSMLSIENVPRPQCGPGEILVRIESAAICGTDRRTLHYGHPRVKYPRILGHENSGVVAEVGPGCSISVGTRVAVSAVIPCLNCRYCREGWHTVCERQETIGYEYDGGFAEYLLAPESAVAAGLVNPLPDGVGFDEGALAEPLACAMNGQDIVGICQGDTVVILGAGAMGCIHAMLARRRGASSVAMVDPQGERLECAARFGADAFHTALPEDMVGRADVAIVACSSSTAQGEALRSVRRRGRVSLFAGLPAQEESECFDTRLVHYSELSVFGASGSAPEQNRLALRLMAAGAVQVGALVTSTYPLSMANEAFATSALGSQLKVVIKPGMSSRKRCEA